MRLRLIASSVAAGPPATVTSPIGIAGIDVAMCILGLFLFSLVLVAAEACFSLDRSLSAIEAGILLSEPPP